MNRFVRLTALVLASTVLPLATTGCASGVAHWIVRMRNHQGDVSLANKNFPDASVAYQLALKIDPTDTHARAGLTAVQIRLAETLFSASKFEDALAALAVAARYAPGDDRVIGLRNEIEQAQIKRDIVVSNYPQYQVTGRGLQRAYVQLRASDAQLIAALKRFDYTYDTADLSAAIRQSYALSDDVTRLTNRLVQYRQLVESGIPEHGAENLAPPASLLPLP
ncbi:MAG TPA: tetratricopeptide repeat protein [Candidatus Elarobacter sp.]